MSMKSIVLTIAVASTLLGTACQTAKKAPEARPGYTDTPMLPSGKWHVHDPNRTVPPIVTPAATFSDGAGAPSDAIVLFNGSDLSKWKGEKGPAAWKVDDGYMEVVPKTGYITTKESFGDFQLHLEFAEPTKLTGDSQDRGNSGVFLHGIYEIQVLDCYNNPTYPDGQTAAIYGQSPPLVNACRKPGEWQTYDIVFEGPRFDDNQKLKQPARVTVIHNGLLVQNHQALLGPTGHRILAKYTGHEPDRGPIALQDHGNRVRYRNIWIREIQPEEQP
jgi:hypothetical protein